MYLMIYKHNILYEFYLNNIMNLISDEEEDRLELLK